MRSFSLIPVVTALLLAASPGRAVLDLLQLSPTFSGAVYVTAPPGDTERLFVVEQAGRIRIFNLDTNTLNGTHFLDIDPLVLSGGERGLLGLAFLTAQMYDYSQLPFKSGDTIFGTTFYTLTGFHGAHVAGGIIFMMVMLVRSLGGQFSAERHEAVEACSFYWHFVDVVWIALFTTLYIV